MCFLPSMNGNRYFGSLLLSRLVQWMRGNTDCLFLYTLADGFVGKCGYVYQAANFHYIGSFTSCVYRCRGTGERIHPRSARLLLEENAAYDGVEKRFWLTHEFCEYKGIEKIQGVMFRYIYPLNRRARDILSGYPEYGALPYPKEEDLKYRLRSAKGRYVPIPPPGFNKEICQFNTQKWGMAQPGEEDERYGQNHIRFQGA